jgi:hypothetical protein
MVLDPRELLSVESELPPLGQPVLLQALDGFIDAGNARRLAREHLLTVFPAQPVARFDVDQLLDYRARRPVMLFAEDHWESYDDPALAVHLLHDGAGTPFLLLDGPEPDVQWERFLTATRLLVEQLDVGLTVGLTAIPMAVPHTRPVGVIAHGNRPELLAGYEPWVGRVQVPGSVGNLLEFRLGQAGHAAIGFAVHVPHYLTQVDYPAASVALLDAVARASGLVLPTDGLREAADRTTVAIDAQVAEAPQVADVVRALEGQYDAFVAGRGHGPLDAADGPLPTADELGAELERFLAEQTGREGPDER